MSQSHSSIGDSQRSDDRTLQNVKCQRNDANERIYKTETDSQT